MQTLIQTHENSTAIVLFLPRTESVSLTILPGHVYFPVLDVNAWIIQKGGIVLQQPALIPNYMLQSKIMYS